MLFADAFKGLESSLAELHLEQNKIETIEKDTFNSLYDLENLYLESNSISTIHEGISHQSSYIKRFM